MATIRGLVEKIFVEAFEKEGFDGKFGAVVKSQRPDLCQFQCNGALAVAKAARKNPREIAQAIVDGVQDNSMIAQLEIAGPGFINITLTDSALLSFMEDLVASDSLQCDTTNKNSTVVIDFGGPNVAKPMHVGHLRSAIIGDSLQRLFRFLGYTVISDNHLGDWGTQMGMLISELRRRKPSLPYFDAAITDGYPTEPPITIADLEQMYPEASKKCKADPELMAEAVTCTDELQQGRPGFVALWKHFVQLSVDTLKKDFDKLDVTFDHWLGESFYMERMGTVVERLKADGVATMSNGATVIEVQEESDKKEIPPVMLVKSGGGFLYGTSDIATIDYRMEAFNPDRIYYVVDKRQSLHFEQVFRAVRKAGIVTPETHLEHIGFGTVNGQDGKPYKTRDGGVMKLGDLIALVNDKAAERMDEVGVAADESEEYRQEVSEMIGSAALKFADLQNVRTSDYIFDIEKFSKFEGKTGPYLLYAAVRIKSILRKTKEAGFEACAVTKIGDQERSLVLELGRLEDVLLSATVEGAPHILCEYVYNLSQEFNRFYRACHIMKEKDEAVRGGWITLSQEALRTITIVLDILGIKIPEKM